MAVYVDVLLVVNLFVNYALLLCSSMIMKRKSSGLRILLGAVVGSIYGLIIFLPDIPSLVELAIRIVASGLIVLCSFGFKNIRYFLRSFFTFFAVSFAFGGIMLVLWVSVAPTGMVYNNGAVYFDINLAVLAVTTVVCFGIVSLISHFIAKKAPKNSVFIITIRCDDKTVTGTALSDTGNSLHESFSGYPVIVGELSMIEKIVPDAVKKYIESSQIESESTKMRLVVHKTVSGTGVLPAFRPEFVEIKMVGKKIRTDKVYIAVTKNRLANGEYSFILNPELFDEEKIYAEVT